MHKKTNYNADMLSFLPVERIHLALLCLNMASILKVIIILREVHIYFFSYVSF